MVFALSMALRSKGLPFRFRKGNLQSFTFARSASVLPQSNSDKDDANNDKVEYDEELVKLIHAYPTKAKASPYDILNLNSHDNINKSMLKQRFFKLAKIYHPDSSSLDGHPLKKSRFQASDEVLTDEVKDERFKKVLAAYNLLRNPLSKRNYDQYHIGWDDNLGHVRTNPNMYDPNNEAYEQFVRRSRSFNSRRAEQAYETAYGFPGDKSWQATENGTFREEFQKNKRTILLSTLMFLTVYTALQMTHIYLYDDFIGGKYNESTSQSLRLHDKSQKDLMDAYSNFGLGDAKEDRINRFLWFRQLSLLLEMGDIHEIIAFFHKKGVVQRHKDGTQTISAFNYENSENVLALGIDEETNSISISSDDR